MLEKRKDNSSNHIAVTPLLIKLNQTKCKQSEVGIYRYQQWAEHHTEVAAISITSMKKFCFNKFD